MGTDLPAIARICLTMQHRLQSVLGEYRDDTFSLTLGSVVCLLTKEVIFYHLMTISWPLWMTLQTPAWFDVHRCPPSQKQLSQLAVVVTHAGSSKGLNEWAGGRRAFSWQHGESCGWEVCNIMDRAVNLSTFHTTSDFWFESHFFGYFKIRVIWYNCI